MGSPAGERIGVSPADRLLALAEALRPKQWIKNGVLFAGLVFALRLADRQALLQAGWAFVVFCAISSAGYMFNDLADVEQDRRHPRKRTRPLASGRLHRGHVLGMGAALLVVGLGGAALVGPRFFLLTLGYAALNFAYNAGLKHAVLLDVFALASFFVLRMIAGTVAIDVPISPWLYIC